MKPDNLPQMEGKVVKISPREKFDILLKMFGTDKARENFISMCKEYSSQRVGQEVSYGDAENYRHNRKISYSPPKRAALHNSIMDIIAKIAVQTKSLSPAQQLVLKDFQSRESVAEAIRAYLLAGKKIIDDEEEEAKKSPTGKSDVARFHSLGREH